MTDELLILVEAMRRAQAKIAFYLEPGNGNPQKAFDELVAILDHKDVVNAMHALQANGASVLSPANGPSMLPPDVAAAERALHTALPGS